MDSGMGSGKIAHFFGKKDLSSVKVTQAEVDSDENTV